MIITLPSAPQSVGKGKINLNVGSILNFVTNVEIIYVYCFLYIFGGLECAGTPLLCRPFGNFER
jgi:hypothetical protein